jgi:hypothetical protein
MLYKKRAAANMTGAGEDGSGDFELSRRSKKLKRVPSITIPPKIVDEVVITFKRTIQEHGIDVPFSGILEEWKGTWDSNTLVLKGTTQDTRKMLDKDLHLTEDGVRFDFDEQLKEMEFVEMESRRVGGLSNTKHRLALIINRLHALHYDTPKLSDFEDKEPKKKADNNVWSAHDEMYPNLRVQTVKVFTATNQPAAHNSTADEEDKVLWREEPKAKPSEEEPETNNAPIIFGDTSNVNGSKTQQESGEATDVQTTVPLTTKKATGKTKAGTNNKTKATQ